MTTTLYRGHFSYFLAGPSLDPGHRHVQENKVRFSAVNFTRASLPSHAVSNRILGEQPQEQVLTTFSASTTRTYLDSWFLFLLSESMRDIYPRSP